MRGTVKHKQRRTSYVLDEMRLKVVGTVGDATCSNIGEARSLARAGAADAHRRRSDAAGGLRRRSRDRQLHLRGRSWEQLGPWAGRGQDRSDDGALHRDLLPRAMAMCAAF